MFGLYLYPEAKGIMERQQDIGWLSQEIKVEKDIQDYRVNMDAGELTLVQTTLQLFVEIEQNVGEIWAKVEKWFPHSEIEGCCSAISAMEKSVHAFFYQKMSDELNINPEDTLRAQQTVEELKEKLSFLNNILLNADDNKPLTLSTVALIEQVLLFSNFAMLKSFQANGNNLIPNTISGVDYVVNDEVLHGEFAAYLFNTYIDEMTDFDSNYDVKELQASIRAVVTEIIKHEDAVIDYLFKTKDKYINGINSVQLKQFIRHRANYVLNSIGMSNMYEITDNNIATWFYKGANAIKMHDFFVKGTNSYSRTWSEDSFTRLGVLND
jgi:ribonucleotide reductase beta subunit family protein with ferritin-like domain